MKRFRGFVILLTGLFASPYLAEAQVSPVYYPSNYLRVVQPDVDDSTDPGGIQPCYVNYGRGTAKSDTLLNPFTGGLNNPTFFNIDFNGDGLQDLYVFDRELSENQFLLFEGMSKGSAGYRYAPQFEYGFPSDVSVWVEMADYNKDGMPDLFTAPKPPGCNTCIKAYKNTSYVDKSTGKFIPQFKTIADTLFYYDSSGNKAGIDVSTASNPQFVDVDKDGYLDILAFDESLNAPRYYRNRGKKGTDSLSFYFSKCCWGYFTSLIQHQYLPWNCEWDSANHKHVNYCGTWDMHKSTSHQYNSMCAFDVDCDGDIDLLLGDGLSSSLAYLENGNIDFNNSQHKDTIINDRPGINNNFPANDPAVIQTMPTPSFVDINNDSLSDLVVAAGEPTAGDTALDRIHNIWYYTNHGSKPSSIGGASNVFTLSSKDFLQNTMVDWGINSAPCFIDIDKDGRKDLIVAVKDGGNKKGFSHLILYLSKAGKTAASKPYLLFQTNDYLGFSKLPANIGWPVPAAYFNKMDSSTNLIIGNDSGQVMYFKDRSKAKSPADFHLAQSSLKYRLKGKMVPISVGANSAPTAVDINGDKKMDLLIGSNIGNISYYRCLGFGSAPDYVPYFELVTDTFGGLNTKVGTDYQAAPCVADLDKDGKPDLLVGDRYGRLLYFHDFDTIHTLVPSNQVRVWNYGTNQVENNKLFSTYTIPAVADIDQDGVPDIMLGCRRGGLFFLGSVNNGFENLRNADIEQPITYNPTHIELFPNPAKDMVTLEYINPDKIHNAEVLITDIRGRRMLTYSLVLQNGKGKEQISTTGLANGTYIVEIFSGDQLIFSNKLIIDK